MTIFESSHLALIGGLHLGSNEALLSLTPVDDGPHLVEVARARVLVVQVVSVLPDVDVDDRHNVGAHIVKHVLVGRGHVTEGVLALVVDEPAPARALDGSGALVELLDELIEATPRLHETVVEWAFARQLAVGRRAERVPEELVVKMTATIEADLLG